MENPIIDEKVKTYLIACLVTGIDVNKEPDVLMAGLVDYMNSTERMFWAQGDEDGVIIHDKHDNPLMNVLYDGKRMKFTTFDSDEFEVFGAKKNIGFSMLNIIGFLGSWELDFQPSILGSEAHVVEHLKNDDVSNSNPEDWSL